MASPRLWNLNQLRIELGRNRRSLERALSDLLPDGTEDYRGSPQPRWFLRNVVNHLYDRSTAMDLSSERAKLAHLQAVQKEMEIGREAGDLMEQDDVVGWVTDMIGAAKSRLLSLPRSLAPLLAGINKPKKIEKALSAGINTALHELSTDLSHNPQHPKRSARRVATAARVNGK